MLSLQLNLAGGHIKASSFDYFVIEPTSELWILKTVSINCTCKLKQTKMIDFKGILAGRNI